MSALGELHRRLETGQIDEKDFDLEEARLLEQIEALARIRCTRMMRPKTPDMRCCPAIIPD